MCQSDERLDFERVIMKTLSHDEMYKVFRKLGFSNFSVISYDAEIAEITSMNEPDSGEKYVCEKVYTIDVVPGVLENGLKPDISLMEKYYNKPSRYKRLREKWNKIIVEFLCYYPLESLFVSGMELPDDPNFSIKTPNQNGYDLEFSIYSIKDLEHFVDLVMNKTCGDMTFWFASIQMAIHYVREDLCLFASVKKQTEENAQAVALLEKLVTAQGLYFRS